MQIPKRLLDREFSDKVSLKKLYIVKVGKRIIWRHFAIFRPTPCISMGKRKKKVNSLTTVDEISLEFGVYRCEFKFNI